MFSRRGLGEGWAGQCGVGGTGLPEAEFLLSSHLTQTASVKGWCLSPLLPETFNSGQCHNRDTCLSLIRASPGPLSSPCQPSPLTQIQLLHSLQCLASPQSTTLRLVGLPKAIVICVSLLHFSPKYSLFIHSLIQILLEYLPCARCLLGIQ